MKEKFFVKKGNDVFLYDGSCIGYAVGSISRTRSFMKNEGIPLPRFLKVTKYFDSGKKHLNIALLSYIDSLALLEKIESFCFGASVFDVEIVNKDGSFGGGFWH